MGHKWLKKKRVSLVEKNVRKTERFFDNHYKFLIRIQKPYRNYAYRNQGILSSEETGNAVIGC
jgi:hypothetical protein